MNVVDSSAWLGYFASGPNADRFAAPIAALRDLLVPSLTTARQFQATLWTQDADFEHIEGVRYFPKQA